VTLGEWWQIRTKDPTQKIIVIPNRSIMRQSESIPILNLNTRLTIPERTSADGRRARMKNH